MKGLFFRLFIIVAVLLGAGLLFTSGALAAPPQQAPSPDELAQSVNAFLSLLITLAVGGGIAYLLQMFPKWAAWESPFKPYIVILIVALVGGGLTALQTFATPELLGLAPMWVRAFLGFIVALLGSQLTYQRGFDPKWKGP